MSPPTEVNGSTARERSAAPASPGLVRVRMTYPATATRTTTAPMAASHRPGRARAVSRVPAESAAAKAPQLANRSAGGLASARCTAASTPAGTAGRTARMLRGVSVITRAMMVWVLAPVCGGSPTSIS